MLCQVGGETADRVLPGVRRLALPLLLLAFWAGDAAGEPVYRGAPVSDARLALGRDGRWLGVAGSIGSGEWRWETIRRDGPRDLIGPAGVALDRGSASSCTRRLWAFQRAPSRRRCPARPSTRRGRTLSDGRATCRRPR